MEQSITVETELFNYRDVKPNFINPCCFGEDFATWLKQEVTPTLMSSGYELSNIIQEDYGWGFWASHEKDPFWIAISHMEDEGDQPSAEWIVSVNYDPGLSLMKRLFHKPDPAAFDKLRDRIRRALAGNPAIKVVD
jgi:hypothetical protein